MVEQKFPKRYILVWLATLPFDIFGFICVLLIRVLAGQKLHWNNGLWCEFKKKTLFYRAANFVFKKISGGSSLGGVTLLHCGIYLEGSTKGPGIDTNVELHESIHTEQAEAAMLVALVYAIIFAILGYWVLAGIVWFFGWLLTYLAGGTVALLRGEDFYTGNHLEGAAYAQQSLQEEVVIVDKVRK